VCQRFFSIGVTIAPLRRLLQTVESSFQIGEEVRRGFEPDMLAQWEPR
jgi:hypothetical protein